MSEPNFITEEQLKTNLMTYGKQADMRLRDLYNKFEQFRFQYWRDVALNLPAALITITDMNNKKLARYLPRNEYKINYVIEFNQTFLNLNWDDKRIVEEDRTLVDHILLHHMIHHFLYTIKGERNLDPQPSHGRSFRREAKRIGLVGKGRLMSCPYPVKMEQISHAKMPIWDWHDRGKKLAGTSQLTDEEAQEFKQHLNAAVLLLAEGMKRSR